MSIIPVSHFARCIICGLTREEIMRLYPGRSGGAYYLNKFCNHLASHGIKLQFYCEFHLGIRWPRCPVAGVPVGCRIAGAGLLLAHYKRGVGITKEMSPAFRRACERASVVRKGAGNPMFGKAAWNKNLPPDHPYLVAMAAKRQGVVEGPETRLKHRLNRAAHPRKARHTTPHADATKERIAQHTAEMHEHHAFGRESSLNCRLREALVSLGLCPIDEYRVGRFAIDCALPQWKVALEADGDFFHCNPSLYPDGPTCHIQRRNLQNDKAKDAFLKQAGWIVLRFWETDILKTDFPSLLKEALIRASVLQPPKE